MGQSGIGAAQTFGYAWVQFGKAFHMQFVQHGVLQGNGR